MSHWYRPVRRVLQKESGSASVQHAALLALIVTVSAGAVQTFGDAVQDYFQRSDTAFSLSRSGQPDSVRIRRGRRIGQNIPHMSLQERLRVAEERKAQRIAELRERAARRQH